MDSAHKPPLVVILGPTAVGKTEIAIEVAGRMNGEIVSADSRLFYRGMDVGTAKPSRAEQERVRHHLIDVADPGEPWSLAVFQKEAHRVIREIHTRGRLPFLVGGTGQYIRAVIESWETPQVEPQPGLRAALEAWASDIGPHGLHARLAALDPQAAAQIDPRNLRRTIRAIEVIFTTGRLFSAQRKVGPSPYHLLLLGLSRSRAELYERVDARIDAMLEAGLVDEVRRLLEKGYAPDLPTFSAIGYREIIAYLQSQITLEEAITQIRRNTRIFVRRQANWFKPDDPAIRWFQVQPGVVESLTTEIREWLSALDVKGI